MKSFVLTPKAEEDFDAIDDYLALIIYSDREPLQILRIWNGRQDPREIEGGLSE